VPGDAGPALTASGDAGIPAVCGPSAADPCGIACYDLSIPSVSCGGAQTPAGIVPLSSYVPRPWWTEGGTAQEDSTTSRFDAETCVFTLHESLCDVTWRIDVKQKSCKTFHWVLSDDQCLGSCPVDCTLLGR